MTEAVFHLFKIFHAQSTGGKFEGLTQQGSTNTKQLFFYALDYYLEVFESMTQVNIIGSTQKWIK